MWQKLKNRRWGWLPVTIASGFIPITISQDLINTLYAVIGIVFGIGFSLIISSVYSGVGNSGDRIRMRNKVKNTRDIFIFYFIVSTIMIFFSSIIDRDFVIAFLDKHIDSWKEQEWLSYAIMNYKLSMATFFMHIITIAVFLRNYQSLQELNEDLDEVLAK